MKSDPTGLLRLVTMAFALVTSTNALGADADAAKALMKDNGCGKCHSVDKKKEGPSFKEVAAKYKDKPDAQQAIVTHLTTGAKNHKIIKAKDPADVANLADWILAQ